MALTDTSLLNVLTGKMAYLSQRQAVLAQNVANANTPGFIAKDLAPFTFTDALKQASSGMKVTNPNHILPSSMAGVNADSKKAQSFETLPDGNSVDLEQQMMKVSQTATDYQSVMAIYKKFMGLFSVVIGKA